VDLAKDPNTGGPLARSTTPKLKLDKALEMKQKERSSFLCPFLSVSRVAVLSVRLGDGIIPITAHNFRSGAFRTFASDNAARFSAGSRARLSKVLRVFCCEERQISDKLPDARLTFSFYVGNVVVDDRRFGCW
jgi:hypothetical protein